MRQKKKKRIVRENRQTHGDRIKTSESYAVIHTLDYDFIKVGYILISSSDDDDDGGGDDDDDDFLINPK